MSKAVSDKIEIFPAELSYAGAIAGIDRECFSEPDSEITVRDLISNENIIMLVCSYGGKVVSYCSAMVVLDEAQIINVATLPEYKGRGFAYMTLCRLLESAKERGAVSASLEVRVSNAPAIHIYEKTGFKACGVRKNFYKKPAEDAIVMVAKL